MTRRERKRNRRLARIKREIADGKCAPFGDLNYLLCCILGPKAAGRKWRGTVFSRPVG